jgi:hypothetical protein
VNFNSHLQPCSFSTIYFLLDRSRVVARDESERNFHAFYQFLRGDTATLLNIRLSAGRHYMGDPINLSAFRFLHGCTEVTGRSDSQDYAMTERAFAALGIDDQSVWRMIAAILILGNIRFFQRDGTEAVEGENVVQLDSKQCEATAAVESLLGLASTQFNVGICCKVVKGTSIAQKLPVCKKTVSWFCTLLYDRLFSWISDSINESIALKCSGSVPHHSLVILDMFGFAKFASNNLQQLCINYANERLQFQFYSHVFSLEPDIYSFEDVDFKSLATTFVSIQAIGDRNLGICAAIGGNPTSKQDDVNIISVLHDQTKVPSPDSQELQSRLFLQSLFQVRGTQQGAFLSRHVRGPETLAHSFTVDHQAIEVTYNTEDFVAKDRDYLGVSLVEMIKTSKDDFLKDLLLEEEDEAEAAIPVTPKKQVQFAPVSSFQVSPLKPFDAELATEVKQPEKRYVVHTILKRRKSKNKFRHEVKVRTGISLQFCNSLSKLLLDLDGMVPHYIRCIRPNEVNKPLITHWPEVLRQLSYSGIEQALSLWRHGHVFKMPFTKFLAQYGSILEFSRANQPNLFQSAKQATFALLTHMGANKDVVLGKSRVFFRHEHFCLFQKHLIATQIVAKKMLVSLNRSARLRRSFQVCRGVAIALREAVAQVDVNCGRAATLQAYRERIQRLLQVATDVQLTKVPSLPVENAMHLIDALCFLIHCDLQTAVVEAQKSLDNLQNVFRIQSGLEECLRVADAEVVYEQVCKLVEDGKRFDMLLSSNQTIAASLAKIRPLAKKRTIIKQIEIGLEQGDDEILKASIENAKKWGLAGLPGLVAAVRNAESMIAQIAQEKFLILKLTSYLLTSGTPRGAASSPQDVVSPFQELALCLAEVKAWPGGIVGRTGKQQILIAETTVRLRQAVSEAVRSNHSQDWDMVGEPFEHLFQLIHLQKLAIEQDSSLISGRFSEEITMKTNSIYWSEDILFMERIMRRPELEHIYARYEQHSLKGKCRKSLRDAALSKDFGLLDQSINSALSLNMQINNEYSLRIAQGVLNEINVIARHCLEALVAFRSASVNGINDQHINALEAVHKSAIAKFPLIVNHPDYKSIVTELKRCEAEEAITSALKQLLSSSNEWMGNLHMGKQDSFPTSDALIACGAMAALESLSSCISAAKNLPFKTDRGRDVARFATVFCDVRKALFSSFIAASENPSQSFQSVLTGDHSNDDPFSPDSSIFTKIQWLNGEIRAGKDFGNVDAILKEMNCVDQHIATHRVVSSIMTNLAAAEASGDEAALVAAIQEAIDAGMAIDTNPLLQRASVMLSRLSNLRRLLSDTAEHSDLKKLDELLALADLLKISGSDVERCKDSRVLLHRLEEAVRAKIESDLLQVLEEVLARGINEDSHAVLAALQVCEKLASLREKSSALVEEITQSIALEGVTDSETQALKEIVFAADELGGQRHVPSVERAVSILEMILSESRIVSMLEDACGLGAWCNIGVRPGDFERYQSHCCIDIGPLQRALVTITGPPLVTKSARLSAKYVEILINIRTCLIACLKLPPAERIRNVWAPIVEALQNPILLSMESTLGSSPEILAIRREVVFSAQVEDLLNELKNSAGDGHRLRACILNAKLLGLSSGVIPNLLIAECESQILSRVEEAISTRDEEVLAAALLQARQHNVLLLESPVVCRALSLREDIVKCREENADVIALMRAAVETQGLDMRELVLLEQAVRFADTLGGQNHVQAVKEARSILQKLQSEMILVEELKRLARDYLIKWVSVSDDTSFDSEFQLSDAEQARRLPNTFATLNMTPITKIGRACFRFVESLFPLRESLGTALKNPTPMTWAAVTQIISSPLILEFEYYHHYLELDAIRRRALTEISNYRFREHDSKRQQEFLSTQNNVKETEKRLKELEEKMILSNKGLSDSLLETENKLTLAQKHQVQELETKLTLLQQQKINELEAKLAQSGAEMKVHLELLRALENRLSVIEADNKNSRDQLGKLTGNVLLVQNLFKSAGVDEGLLRQVLLLTSIDGVRSYICFFLSGNSSCS